MGSRPSTGTSTTLNSNSKSTVTRTSTTTTKKLPGVTRTTITKTHTTQSNNPIVAPIEQNQTVTLVHEITNVSIVNNTDTDLATITTATNNYNQQLDDLLIKDNHSDIPTQQHDFTENNTHLENSLILNHVE